MSKSKRVQPIPKAASAQKELKKINLHVNEFGEVVRDVLTEEINTFLDKHVPDKKFSE